MQQCALTGSPVDWKEYLISFFFMTDDIIVMKMTTIRWCERLCTDCITVYSAGNGTHIKTKQFPKILINYKLCRQFFVRRKFCRVKLQVRNSRINASSVHIKNHLAEFRSVLETKQKVRTESRMTMKKKTHWRHFTENDKCVHETHSLRSDCVSKFFAICYKTWWRTIRYDSNAWAKKQEAHGKWKNEDFVACDFIRRSP